MDNKKFVEKCKKIVAKYHNKHTAGEMLMPDDVYVVWLCKVPGNNKALLSTPVPDGMYYEITYNGAKNEAYVDAYKKQTEHMWTRIKSRRMYALNLSRR